jgi:hypothetical protein
MQTHSFRGLSPKTMPNGCKIAFKRLILAILDTEQWRQLAQPRQILNKITGEKRWPDV